MEIRRLIDDEIIQLQQINTIAHNLRRDFQKEDATAKDPLAHPAQWSWGAFKNGKLLSGMVEVNYLMRFDGKNVKMSGIGGVATLPEARKGGLVRRIFEKLLLEAYEKGVVFSCLYPFSHDYYRMFGYEIACARNKVSIYTSTFKDIKSKGTFVQGTYVPLFPGDDTSALQEIHATYIANINHGICRDYWADNRAWKLFISDAPYTTGTFIYLWKDESGKARSYIKYQDMPEDGDHIMSVKELAFADRESLYGILGIVDGLSSQFEKFRWLMPTFIDPTDITGDAWDITQELDPGSMTRVVNVKTALETMRMPSGTGEYVIEVADEQIQANNGKYLVEFAPNEAKVSRTKKDADIRCDILTLAQLVTGYRTLENALRTRRAGLEVYGNQETLHRVFTLRPQHLTEQY